MSSLFSDSFFLILRDLWKDELIVKRWPEPSKTDEASCKTARIPLQGGVRGLRNVPSGRYEIVNHGVTLTVTLPSSQDPGQRVFIYTLDSEKSNWKFTPELEDRADFNFTGLALQGAMNRALLDFSAVASELMEQAPTTAASSSDDGPAILPLKSINLPQGKTAFELKELSSLDQAISNMCQNWTSESAGDLTHILQSLYVHDSDMAKHIPFYLAYTRRLTAWIKKSPNLSLIQGVGLYVNYLISDMQDLGNAEATAAGKSLEEAWEEAKEAS
jgi:hypothetical protein